jgi:anti-sigma factor RsiW
MSCTRSKQDIQDLLDGALGAIRTAELHQHLDQCPSCRALADDLQRLRDVAATMEPLEPPDHVWMQVAGRLRQEGRLAARPAAATTGRGGHAWLAIAAALVLAVGASLWFVVAKGNRPAGEPASTAVAERTGTDPGNAAAADAVQSGVEDLQQAERLLQSGVAKLRDGLGADGQTLPGAVATTLDTNLRILDQAIAESSSALQQEPQNVAARTSLFDALQRKIALLQDTIALMNEVRKGNAAGVAQVVEGSSKS